MAEWPGAVAYTINEPVLDCIEKMEAANSPEWQTDIALARILVREDRFYTPLNMDTRGRIYGIPYFNFQRGDHVRGLFLFADGEPIEGRDVLWLYAHVANRADGNTWSDVQKPSKLSTPDRVSWTIKNEKTVRGIGEAVLAGDDPDRLPLSGLEEPCQFIAACVELVQALDRPDFPTRLPITLDATCSGLQHLCGMTRAEEGRLVNLTSSHRAEDFYAEVAAKVYLDNPDLRSLMQGESDRSIVKQPAMSYFYGSKPGGWAKPKKGKRWRPFGMTKQIADVLKDRKQSTKGAKDLAYAIYRAIEGMVPSAKAVRDFLEQLTNE